MVRLGEKAVMEVAVSTVGGAWRFNPDVLRSAYRDRNPIDDRSDFLGFRIGKSLLPP